MKRAAPPYRLVDSSWKCIDLYATHAKILMSPTTKENEMLDNLREWQDVQAYLTKRKLAKMYDNNDDYEWDGDI